jgi:hypothetical protein
MLKQLFDRVWTVGLSITNRKPVARGVRHDDSLPLCMRGFSSLSKLSTHFHSVERCLV